MPELAPDVESNVRQLDYRELRARLEKAEEASGICLKPNVHKLEAELAAREEQLKNVQVWLPVMKGQGKGLQLCI